MIKILTQNGIENTNLDGARDGYFNSGGKDGISSGILNNGTLTAQGNVLTLDTCEMRIKGHRIVIDEPITKTISGFPTVDTNYQFIAKITYNDGSVTFDTEARPTASLIQDDILNGNGTYEVVIGEFIHKTDGTIANLVQIMRVILGGGGGKDGTTFTPSVSEDGIISWTNDGGKENPPSVNIKGATGNSGVAEGTVNSNTEGTSDTDGYTQQAVNKIASRPNLLINPDFSINQRGQASYTGTNYSVDRWRCSYGTITVLDKGIKHTSANTWQGVYQIIEKPSRLAGKTLTLSANGRASSGGVFRIYIYYQYSGQPRITACTASTESTTDTTISATGIIPSDITDNDRVFVMLYNSLANVDFYCNWVKLEVGSVATTFMPPLIAEELPKCQRYYQALKINGVSFCATSTNIIYTAVPLTVSMRTAPTLTNRNQSSVCVFDEGIKGTADVAFNTLYGNVCQISVDTSTLNMTKYSGGVLVNGDITLDAEIY